MLDALPPALQPPRAPPGGRPALAGLAWLGWKLLPALYKARGPGALWARWRPGRWWWRRGMWRAERAQERSH